ncbi:MAG: GAF domain-containing protein [Anaerolinea sp.]|nr:GAF domain-containing protein [Anaerolinea sp.]
MHILVLDDDELYAHMLGEQLGRLASDWTATAVAAADAARAAVQEAAEPFDVFLLDVRLEGSDVDGVQLMEELKQFSPASDAIVFTGYDVEEGLRAFDAGAYRYLTKPFDTRELVRILKVLQRERNVRRERNWLAILAEVAAQMQGADDVSELADIIVRGGLRFGFRRARLRLFEQIDEESTSDPEMVGVSQAGEPRIEGFEGLRAPLSRLVYSQRAIEVGQPVCFDGREFGPGIHDEFYAAHNMTVPKGHWFKIPLLSGGRRVGALTVDNGDEARVFGAAVIAQLTQVLGLFGAQAAAALERARLHQQAQQTAQEASILSAISRQVTAAAAHGELDELLDELRRQVDGLMDATNFIVVLKDLETDDLDFRRQYEQGELSQRHWRALEKGLCGFVIVNNRAQLIHDTERFCAEHDMRHYGPPAQCWLGVPLRMEGQAIGALVVQSYEDQEAYTAQHQQFLQKVADQVAGAIQMAYQLEREDRQNRQDEALDQLRSALPQLIRESEDSFWHAVLTTVTHREGDSFNRAALFWYSQHGERMQGRMGIGYFTREDARRAWEEDLSRDQTLEQYFKAPHLVRRRVTPLQQEIIDWRPVTNKPDGPCYRTWREAARQVIWSSQLRDSLPAELLQPPDLLDDTTEYSCALVPVKAGDKVLGLLVVDNAFDGEPLRSGDLDKLESVLAEAMRIWLSHQEVSRTQQLGASYEQILALDHRLTAKAADRPLQDSLQALCREAQTLTGADCVVIYPYHSSRGGYDLSLVSHVGLNDPNAFQARTKDKPRQHGVTFTVLQSGVLAVPDVSVSNLEFAGRKLAEHTFLGREQIRALIGAPMRQATTGESLGVIYLDYRTPQSFAELDIGRTEHLAAIGAKVISYCRTIERQEQGLAKAERSEQQRRRDMQLLSNIQRQALAGDSDERKVIRAILKNAAELFEQPVAVTLALLSWEKKDEYDRPVRHDWRLNKLEQLRRRRVDMAHGPIGNALEQNEACLARNALAIPVRQGEMPIAALMIRKANRQATFDAVEQEVAERLATVAAAALDNVRTRAYLQVVAETVGAVADKRGLKDTLQVVIDKARAVAPDIDCVTLWYEDQERKTLVAGPSSGVLNERHQSPNMQTDGLVRTVMNRPRPIFASAVEKEAVLHGDFVKDEGITSAVAFPLHFGEKPAAFGALFFNYRKAHEFTPLERTLFPIFANAAATAIHSAQTIEQAERRGKRLETALALAKQAGASLDRDEVLRGILAELREYFRRRDEENILPYIMLYDEQTKALVQPQVVREFYQPDRPEYQHRVQLPLEGKGITTRTARRARDTKGIVVDNIQNVHADPDYVEVNSNTQSELCAGLVAGERLLGALVIKSDRPAAFNWEDERLIRMAAEQVTLALDRLERVIKARRDASIAGAMAWAADIAHDINNDVGYIRNRAYWLRESKLPISDDGQVWAREIDARAKQLADSVHDARFHRQNPEAFSLTELLHERATAWAATRATNIEVHIEATDAFTVYGDREQLWRVVRHLLRNARDAMALPHSGQQQIILRLETLPPDQVELQIEDSGPGISDEARGRILNEPYSSKGGEGSGYGLLIAQWLVEAMGGSIYLYPSAPDRGACFGIRLPSTLQEERHDPSK